jgi:hypothetical protein
MPARDDLEGMRVYRARSLAVIPLIAFCWLFFGGMGIAGIAILLAPHDLLPGCVLLIVMPLTGYAMMLALCPTAVAINADRFGVRSAGRWRWMTRKEARLIGQSRGWPPWLPGQLPPKWKKKLSSDESLNLPISPRMSSSWGQVRISRSEFPQYAEIVAALEVFFTSDADPLERTPASAQPSTSH